MLHQFVQAKFADGLKLEPIFAIAPAASKFGARYKIVKNDSKIIISLYKSKSEKHTVLTYKFLVGHNPWHTGY